MTKTKRMYNEKEIRIGRFDETAIKYIIVETREAYVFEARAGCEKHVQIHEALEYPHEVRGGGHVYTLKDMILIDEISGEYSFPFTQRTFASNQEPMSKLIEALKEKTGKDVFRKR